MGTKRKAWHKVVEWGRRYLPCEIAGTVAELGGAGAVYLATGSGAAAAVVGTIMASVGYYAVAYVNAVRWLRRDHSFGAANLLALRSIAVEFGPAEVIDSLVIRPICYYVFPILTGSVAIGLVAGKVVADIGFYVCAICSYEKFRRLLAVRGGDRKETGDALVDAVAAA